MGHNIVKEVAEWVILVAIEKNKQPVFSFKLFSNNRNQRMIMPLSSIVICFYYFCQFEFHYIRILFRMA
jgi:hypothetical protein